MLPKNVENRMLADLAMSETAAQGMYELTMLRARLYAEEGLPLERVLGVLHLSRASYYRRLKAALAGAAMTHWGEVLELLHRMQTDST